MIIVYPLGNKESLKDLWGQFYITDICPDGLSRGGERLSYVIAIEENGNGSIQSV